MSSQPPDLNALRDFLRAGEAAAPTSAPPPRVDREGKVHTDGSAGDDRSEIPKGVFARSEREAQEVAQFLPQSTRQVSFGNITGWTYRFENDLGDWYRMWAYFDSRSSLYRVKMVEPEVTEHVNPHLAHYMREGDLCLTRDVGTRSLRDAFSRSVAFSIGWSWWQRNKTFPFNPD